MKTYFNASDGEDSTWKIVYMDMITMLMILFLSLWIIDKNKVRDQGKHGDVTLNKVEFEADDYFDSGKSEIKPAAQSQLQNLFFGQKTPFPALGTDLKAGGRRVVLISGHTDDRGDKVENLELGFERAVSVFRELEKKVPNLGANVGICSYADNFPLEQIRPVAGDAKVRQSNESRRRKNRRFEILGQFEETELGF
ncbi:OmpA family protein [Bdellovibrionota bacterium FG-2]